MSVTHLLEQFRAGDRKALARCITLVENELEGHEDILTSLPAVNVPVCGVTGPPGAGKSTLINALLRECMSRNMRVAVIAIDPTSPFNFGSLLGDRLRMAEHFNDDRIFIRSLATRGSLGGLSAKAVEITDVMKAAGFDLVIVETVGVGQSEVEIVGLADTTVLVLVPEAGDDVQAIKSGVMEIADIFVVNKADRDGADTYARNLLQLVHSKPLSDWQIPVIRSVATRSEGAVQLLDEVIKHHQVKDNPRRDFLLAEKAYKLIQQRRMKDISKKDLLSRIAARDQSFNLYRFVREF